MKNISEFLSENVQFLVVKISIYLNRRVFVMGEDLFPGMAGLPNFVSIQRPGLAA